MSTTVRTVPISTPHPLSWRTIASGIMHLVFGLGTTLFALFVAFPLRLIIRSQSLRRAITQWCLGKLLRLFFFLNYLLGLMRLEISGLNRLQRKSVSGPGAVFIANHPSLLDALAILAFAPHCLCVAKESLRRNFLLRVLIDELGFVTSKESHHLIDACVEKVMSGHNLLLFPEGTRSLPGALGEFHRGAASIVLRSGARVVPVVITCSDTLFPKGARWHDMAPRRVALKIRVCYPVFPRVLEDERSSSRALIKRFKEFFQHQLYGEKSRIRERDEALHH